MLNNDLVWECSVYKVKRQILINNVGLHLYFLQYCNFTDTRGVKFDE